VSSAFSSALVGPAVAASWIVIVVSGTFYLVLK
jgi:hypothetical protein